MPELPEIETVRRVLEPQLTGLQIESVSVSREEVVAYPQAQCFCASLAGREIARMGRRGKFLRLFLDNGDTVVLHLRMTGSLLLAATGDPTEKHTHVVFHLSGGKELRFCDIRRFGRFWLIPAGEADTRSGTDKLGPEPFDADCAYLKDCCANRRKAIKECLLDQHIVAGIGNIYGDEILFAAKIHPNRSANTLSAEEWERLARAIPERLSFFIDKNTVTAEEYLREKGRAYRNAPYLQAYGHEGTPCPRCGALLNKTVIGGRSSVFCPCCQKDAEND